MVGIGISTQTIIVSSLGGRLGGSLKSYEALVVAPVNDGSLWNSGGWLGLSKLIGTMAFGTSIYGSALTPCDNDTASP